MLKKIREFTDRYAIVSSLLIAILFFLLLNGTALVFNLLPNSFIWGYAQELFITLYSVGLVILLGFKSTFKPKGFFKALLHSNRYQGGMLFQRRDSKHRCEEVRSLGKGRMVRGSRRLLNFRNSSFVQHFYRIRSFGRISASNLRHNHRFVFRRGLFEKQKPLGTDSGTRADRYGGAFGIDLPYTDSRRNGQRSVMGSAVRYGDLHFACDRFAPSLQMQGDRRAFRSGARRIPFGLT